MHPHKELEIKIMKQRYRAIASSSIDFLFKSTVKLSRESLYESDCRESLQA